MLAVALTAAAWLPWRTTQQHYSSDYPPYGVPYGPVSALQPDDHGILSEEEERQKKRELAARKRMHAHFGVLDPYEPPGPVESRPAHTPQDREKAKRAQEEAQHPGRSHPPWWWEKPPKWITELPWWLTDKPSNLPLLGAGAPGEGAPLLSKR